MELKARPVKENDLMLVFKWANDPLTRRMSFNQDPIPLETHKQWFRKLLSQQKIYFLIIEGYILDKWTPIAQVRVDQSGEISISLASKFRGCHLASPAIKTAIAYIKDKFLVSELVAHIKHENIISVRVFRRVGFHFIRETTIKGCSCLEYILDAEAFDEVRRVED